MTPVLEVVDLVKHYRASAGLTGGGAVVHAVDGVSFTLGQGEMLGLVGNSGSGKTTIAKCILRLVDPTAGTIRLRGTDITHLSRRALRPLRRELHRPGVAGLLAQPGRGRVADAECILRPSEDGERDLARPGLGPP